MRVTVPIELFFSNYCENFEKSSKKFIFNGWFQIRNEKKNVIANVYILISSTKSKIKYLVEWSELT